MTLSRLASAAALAAAFASPALAQAPAAPDPYVLDFIDRARAALDAASSSPEIPRARPDGFQPALLGLAGAGLAPLPLALTTVETLTSDAPALTELSTLVAPPAPVAAAAPAEAPSVEAVTSPTFQARVVEEPAVVEDPVQIRRGAPPVRMELVQSRRRVVLLPGVGDQEARTAPTVRPTAAPIDSQSRIVTSRAAVLIGEAGQREVVYLSARPAALDLGAETGCGTGAIETGRRLRGTGVTSLRRGMRGDAVRAAQTLLCLAGHAEAGEAGVFDAEMDAAVRAFQRNEGGLAVDGALGPMTRRALDAAVQARHGG